MKSALKGAVRGAVHAMLRGREARLLAPHRGQVPAPPVFMIGAPRSGTSLAYELFVSRYECAYFTNLAHRFYRTPVAATQVGRRLIARHDPAYQSDYGHISGWGAPNEGGWIWQRWFEDGDWCDEGAAGNLDMDTARATVAALQSVMKSGLFLNKNVMHANRMRLLDAVFPGCLFLEVRRDAAATARSIIRAQRKGKGPDPHPDAWWSVRPSTARSGPLVARAAWQVRGIAEDIARDAAHLGGDRLHSVGYEALCAEPDAELQKIAAFLSGHGLPVPARQHVPEGFDLSPSRPLEDAEEALLQRELSHG